MSEHYPKKMMKNKYYLLFAGLKNAYCMDEKSDHKVGTYCNLIGPLDQS